MMTSKILVVEDESIVALDLQARLIRLGYDVVGISASGEEAISLAKDSLPELALMDIRLKGGMDGIETAQQLRAQYNIPVVYLTAYADEPTLQRAKDTEPLGYLIKPFEERELHSTIEMALHKVAMDQIAQAEMGRLQRVIANVPEGVALLNEGYRPVLTNSRALSYIADVGHSNADGCLTHLGDYSMAQLTEASAHGNWREISLATPERRVFEVILAPAQLDPLTADPDPLEWVLVIREVTVERRLQQRLQAQERLAAIGQLAAGIAHDFNNILASIILGTQIVSITEPHLSANARDRLDTIFQQANRASELIKQILDFSRVSVTKIQVFDLVPLLGEMTEMVEQVLPPSITLNVVCPPGDYTLNGDATRILQLLMNLVLNARDALVDGGVITIDVSQVLKLELDDAQEEQVYICIRVADNGTGIHPDVLPHIFEPFFTTKPVGMGTGLGLAQVFGIVQQHAGHITVESELGQGTTITVYLPLMAGAAPVERRPAEAASAQQPRAILLVEDNQAVRQSIGEILELSGYHVVTAANGLEALTALERLAGQIDLVLSDLLMPEMDGLELCREVRRRKIPVRLAIVTGYMSDEMLQELKALDISAYLEKPVDVEQLLTTVERLWQTRPSA